MNEPGIIIIVGIIFWLFVVACFAFGFGWMYQNPRQAWEKGYHRKGLPWLLGGWKDRDVQEGDPTAEELAEVKRRAVLGLVIGLVLSPAIVAISLVVAQGKHQARERWKPIHRPPEPSVQGAERAPAEQ